MLIIPDAPETKMTAGQSESRCFYDLSGCEDEICPGVPGKLASWHEGALRVNA